MEKLARMKRIENALPGLDCGSCGAPTCHALAEDTIRGFAQVKDCIFIKDLKKLNDDGGEI
jgi:Na+-translocating ferredoxin:NAD+ oxidoreductase RNF subunit RnfB